jgi:diguanylate cyclase (GGDEF)-like protein/PAS domain S-box-containing protein
VSTSDTQILLLDDEVAVCEVMRAHLATLGFTCTIETSPLRAIELIRHHTYGLLITDLRMPDLGGLEVVQRAKEIDPDMAIVVVTAMMDIANAIDAMHSGADDYVVKPFNLGEIGRAATRALEKRAVNIQHRQYQEKLENRVQEATEDLERVTAELRDTKQYLVNLLHSTVDAIVTTDAANRIEFINDGALRMLGYAESELLGLDVQHLYQGGKNEVAHLRLKLREEQVIQDYETELVRKDKSHVPVNVSLSGLLTNDGKHTSILAICKDITRQKQLEKELKDLSSKDSLTGLYNQRCFYDRIEDEMERAKRQGRPLTLVLFDIDKFKGYNDSRGHLEGDKALQAASVAIMRSTRTHVDDGFRYGGDEFTVILPEADEQQGETIAERIRKNFESQSLGSLTLSLGLCTTRGEMDVRTLIQTADEMMYESKRAGGNRVTVCRRAAQAAS